MATKEISKLDKEAMAEAVMFSAMRRFWWKYGNEIVSEVEELGEELSTWVIQDFIAEAFGTANPEQRNTLAMKSWMSHVGGTEDEWALWAELEEVDRDELIIRFAWDVWARR